MIEQISVEIMIVVLAVFTYCALWTNTLREIYTRRKMGTLSTIFLFANYLVYCSVCFAYAKIKKALRVPSAKD